MELIDKTVELRGSQVLNMHSYHAIIWQRRIMAFATLLAWIGVGLLVAALATTHWASIDFHNKDYQPVHVDLGVWGEYRTVNDFKKVSVEWIPHFPAPPENILRLADTDLKHYYRSQAFMGCFGAVILLCTNCLAIYTFYHHRYMYKRAVAALYLVVGEWNRIILKEFFSGNSEKRIIEMNSLLKTTKTHVFIVLTRQLSISNFLKGFDE
ncbi:hypothetical protein B9Z55_024155 [Caenorhabditis nigoni]|nr:hypothetical protein B9Z55_024155 [Caenorhabditis nigoni]